MLAAFARAAVAYVRAIPHRELLQPNPRPCCNANGGRSHSQPVTSRDTLALSSLEHDASVGFHAVNDAMNSPIGQVVMFVGGEIPGPVGTAFHVVSAADDVCVMRGCVACMPLLLCVAVVWQPMRLQVQR